MKSAEQIANELVPHIEANNASIGETNRRLAKVGDGQGNARPATLLTPRDVFYRGQDQNDRGVAILSPRCPIPLQAINGYYDEEVWVANVAGTSQLMIVDLADPAARASGGVTPLEGLANSAATPSQDRLVIMRLRPSSSDGMSVFVDVGPYAVAYEAAGGGEGFFSSQDFGFPDPTDGLIFNPTASALTSGQHRLLGIALDSLTGNLFVIPGSAVTASDSLPSRSEFVETDYQAINFTGYYPAGYVYTWFGQTDVVEDDCLRLFDPRLILKKLGGGGGGTLTVTKKTVYVRVALYDNTLGSDGSWDVSSIDQTYDHLEIFFNGADASVDRDYLSIYLNNDTSAGNYLSARWTGGNSNVQTTVNDSIVGTIPTGGSNNAIAVYLQIQNYALTTWKKVITGLSQDIGSGLSTYSGQYVADHWNNTAAINRIKVIGNGSNIKAGSRLMIIGTKAMDVVTDVSLS